MSPGEMRFCRFPRRPTQDLGESWGGTKVKGATVVGMLVAAVCLQFLFGDDAQAMQLTPIQKQDMKQHYEKATRAYDVQKYSEAVEEYQKAYEIGGDPAMLYNVAQSYRLADQLPEALRFYRRYLQRSPNARNREDVERKISELEKTIEERRRAAAAVPVPAPAPLVVVPSPAAPSRADEGTSGTLIAGIVVASLGAAALGTAAITGKMASGKGDELSNASTRGDTYDPALQEDGKLLDKVTIVSAIVGGVAVITGVVLIILSQTGESEGSGRSASARSSDGGRASLSPVLGPGIMGAAASVRF